jgi:hypothetical protein
MSHVYTYMYVRFLKITECGEIPPCGCLESPRGSGIVLKNVHEAFILLHCKSWDKKVWCWKTPVKILKTLYLGMAHVGFPTISANSGTGNHILFGPGVVWCGCRRAKSEFQSPSMSAFLGKGMPSWCSTPGNHPRSIHYLLLHLLSSIYNIALSCCGGRRFCMLWLLWRLWLGWVFYGWLWLLIHFDELACSWVNACTVSWEMSSAVHKSTAGAGWTTWSCSEHGTIFNPFISIHAFRRMSRVCMKYL